MKGFKLSLLDIFQGTWLKIRYLVLILSVLLLCSNFLSTAEAYMDITGNHDLSLADCLAFIIQGTTPGNRNNAMESFVMPTTWLLFMLLQLLLPLDHPPRSKELWGCQYMVRTSRRLWWVSKSAYTLAVNLLGFGLYLITAAIFCAASHIPLSMSGSEGFYRLLFGAADLSGFSMVTAAQNAILLIALPLAALWAMSMIQLFLSIWLNPFVAYFTSVCILVLSAWFDVPWLLGNHAMAIRSSFIDSRGIEPATAAIWCLAVGAAVFAAGWIGIRKMDMSVLKKEES